MKVGKVFYGLHFAQGVAEYKDMPQEGGKPLRIFINSDTAKKMDATFPGRPVFVHHKENMTTEDFKEADGYVVESFFNKADGNHWAKFIVTSEKGEEALKNGWKLSNAYFKMKQLGSGKWHGVEYDREIVEGEYEHLAIVDNPRYEESEVLTPEDFKAYNSEKESELIKLSNSKDKKPLKEKKGMLSIFKREKVENSGDLEGAEVLLPRCGKTVSIMDLVANADKDEMEGKAVNGDDLVDVGDKKMSVNELVEAYKAKNSEDEEAKKKAENEEAEEAKKKAENEEAEKEKEANMGDDEKKAMENEKEEEAKKKAENEEAEEEKKKAENAMFNSLKGAEDAKISNSTKIIETSESKIARGVSRYGSN